MARTDKEVADILLSLYEESFAGKKNQRYLISWPEIRALYGFGSLFQSRFDSLKEAAATLRKRLYLFDLGDSGRGHLVAVIRRRTIDRWRRVPKRTIEQYILPMDDEPADEEDDD